MQLPGRAALFLIGLAANACHPGPAAPPPDRALGAGHAQPSSVAAGSGLATGTHGAVSSAESNASRVGLSVLESGGNAVDAAVALAFALGVTQPAAGNIGGGGFLLLRLPDGRTTAIDYRETAPSAARRDMYLDAAGRLTADAEFGPRAAGIPGVISGLALVHEKFGSRPWAELIAPAIRLAGEGHALDSFHARALKEACENVREYLEPLHAEPDPSAERAALVQALESTLQAWSRPSGEAYRAGDLWRQEDLAATLEQIAEQGAAVFYRGPWAQQLAARVRAMGGIWSADDLAHYQAVERTPIHFAYHGQEIFTMPPPSAGGVVLRQILGAADALGLATLDWDSVARIHLYVEILRRTYADRNQLMGDPDFVRVPIARLLSDSYIRQRIGDIDRGHATPSSQIRAGAQLAESNHTTHFSVADAAGMAVANTFTLNTSFGALVQVPHTGVTLNNEMDDFTSKLGEPNSFGLVQGTQNAIEPGKRMLSSMSPTIVIRDGQLRAVLGSPGGPTITTTVAQILMQLIDHGRSLEAAIRAPRIHHQWLPDQIYVEPGVPLATQAGLLALGHRLSPEGNIGHANCIEFDAATQEFRAVADVERDGGAALAY